MEKWNHVGRERFFGGNFGSRSQKGRGPLPDRAYLNEYPGAACQRKSSRKRSFKHSRSRRFRQNHQPKVKAADLSTNDGNASRTFLRERDHSRKPDAYCFIFRRAMLRPHTSASGQRHPTWCGIYFSFLAFSKKSLVLCMTVITLQQSFLNVCGAAVQRYFSYFS